jgi:Ca-activated chloride channel family protein
VFGAPSVDAIYAAQELWQSARKPVNLVMLVDRSGSMRGDKIENVRRAAAQFVEQMGDQDRLTLIAFSSRPAVLIEYARIGDARQEAIDAINDMPASGNTALYDAIALGTQIIADTTSSQRTNVMVVLSDGLDTSSARAYSRQLIVDATAHNTTVFTIAYGSDADHDLMRNMANLGNGTYYEGTEANIAGIYQDMSAAFGGAAGIGR